MLHSDFANFIGMFFFLSFFFSLYNIYKSYRSLDLHWNIVYYIVLIHFDVETKT